MPSKTTIFVALVIVGAVLLVISTSGLVGSFDEEAPPVGSGWSLR